MAYQLNETCYKLDTWLEENGADLTDVDLRDSTISGCMIYCEPDNAKTNVMEYIESKKSTELERFMAGWSIWLEQKGGRLKLW